MNELISDGDDCRTAPATPGLLNIVQHYVKANQDFMTKDFQEFRLPVCRQKSVLEV